MLSLPSVNSTPVALPRPVLTADAALRPVATVRAIEPTTAISKERSRVESRLPEGVSRTELTGTEAAVASVQSPLTNPPRQRVTSPVAPAPQPRAGAASSPAS